MIRSVAIYNSAIMALQSYLGGLLWSAFVHYAETHSVRSKDKKSATVRGAFLIPIGASIQTPLRFIGNIQHKISPL